MPYCTPQNVRDRHKLLTADDFPDDYVSTYISTAQTRMNNRIAPHYVVPFPDPVPDIINSICADLAASLLLNHHFSDINYRDNTPLSEVYRKQAVDDMEFMIDNATIDDLPGVVKREPDLPEMRKKVATSTPLPSQMQRTMKKFDWATQIPLSNVREWP